MGRGVGNSLNAPKQKPLTKRGGAARGNGGAGSGREGSRVCARV